MEHFRLIVFEAVWSLGSYTKAARQLGITQPAVSQNIAELEKELGVELFTRTGPTPAAEVFVKLARRALKDYEDIRTLFNPETGSEGTVRIRADRSASEYVLPRIVNVLKAAHPNINFEVLPFMETDTAPADVTITTIPISQDGTTALRFEAFGPATPFLAAVRLLLSESSLIE